MTLYVSQHGSTVRRSQQRLIVARGGVTVGTARLRELERLVLIGSIELTAPAMGVLLEQGIETVILSASGRYRGRLAPAEAKNIFLRQAQFRRYEEEAFRLGLARTVVGGKIRNARAVLQRHQRNHPDADLDRPLAEMEKVRQAVATAAGIERLMGLEGEAARSYFAALGGMIRREFAFSVRSRRPPRDPVNALLSFGYMLLLSELTGAAAAAGLDPHVGYLHSLDYGRPSLALDLLEEFRQPVIDRLVMSLINRGVLKQEHFELRGDGGVLLTDSARPRFLELYDRAMTTEFDDRFSGSRVCFRELGRRQAMRIRQAILGEAEYEPYGAR